MVGTNRPLLAWLYNVTTPLFGDHALRWQFFGLFSRWFASVGVWWTFGVLWPKHKFQVASIAIIFSVYPGFLQQSISIIYSHYFLIYGLFLISLGIMVSAIRKNSWVWWGISILISGYCMFSIQYFVGLEIARLMLIWLALSDRNYSNSIKKRILDLFIYWAPYLGLLLLLIVWRLYLLPTTNYQPSLLHSLIGSPSVAVSSLLQIIVQDAFEVSFVAWQKVLNILDLLDIGSEFQQEFSGVIIIVSLVAFTYFSRLRKQNNHEITTDVQIEDNWTKQAISLGVLMIFGAGWPFWIVPIETELRFPLDRLTLPMMIGTSILLIGLLELSTKSVSKKIIVLTLILGFAAGFHFKISYTYKLERLDQERLLWHLAWRIPSLKPGTAILTDDFPFVYNDDQALTASINFMYDYKDVYKLPYGFFVISETLGDELSDLDEESPIYETYGLTSFSGSTSQAIVVYIPPFSCMRVLNSFDEELIQNYPGMLPEILSFSDQSNILRENKVEHQNITKWFGPPVQHGWCYYYEKADLARQFGDWEEIVDLGNEAFGGGIQYFAPEELYPFIEGYARAGDIAQAKQLTDEVRDISLTYKPQLCGIWGRIFDGILSGTADNLDVSEIIDSLGCYD